MGKLSELYPVGKTVDFVDLKPMYVTPKQSITIAVYRHGSKYFAYLDRCPHQGGPACEGITIGDSIAEIKSDGTLQNHLSSESYNIACPWHGLEFDLETGICRANRRDRLRSYDVVVEDGEVKVKL